MMADDPSDEEILEVLERLGPKWQTLKETIKSEVAEALKSQPQPEPAEGGNYLEKQNAMLLNELLAIKKGQPLTQDEPGDPKDEPKSKPSGKEKKPVIPADLPNPEPKKAFWR